MRNYRSKNNSPHKRFIVAALIILSLAVTLAADQSEDELICRQTADLVPLNSNNNSAGPKYAPDRQVDILNLLIDITPDFLTRTIEAETTIHFSPILKPLRELRLDAIDLRISSITASTPIANHTYTDEEIIITFVSDLQPENEYSVTIAYTAEPKQGLYFRTPQMGYPEQDTHLWTQGEPHYARHWIPTFDYPNERCRSEIICRVPADMVVLSNGKEISQRIDPVTGLQVSHWRQDIPHVNYLIALAAGKFKKIEADYKDIPLAFYTPASQIDQAQNSFADTADIMTFFENQIGIPYPWHQYNQVVVDDFTAGGMENTTLTILNTGTLFTTDSQNIRSSQRLVAHELAHQWFGDYVTCKDWSHLWLNEGFATYYAHLYDGHKNGQAFMLYGLYSDSQNRIFAKRDKPKPIVYRDYQSAREQFDYRAYPKGSWILHMLRSQLGDELYHRCIKTYLQRHALDSVVTEDLRNVIEQFTGKSYDRFFDQWLYHPGYPKLTINYNWMQKEKLAKITIEQTQPTNQNIMLFHLQSQVRFIVNDAVIDQDVQIDKRKQEFYFPLDNEPNSVRFDPHYSLLADINFKKPTAMLYTQLENNNDIIGQLQAIKALEKKEDKKTVKKLQAALNHAKFYGIRIKAASALRTIQTDEAFEALTASQTQPDARVRLQVTKDLGRFYRPESLQLSLDNIESEKNPDILAESLKNLGRYHTPQTRQILIKFLSSSSYQNRLANAAISAIAMQAEPAYIEPLLNILKERKHDLTTSGFSNGLKTLAKLAAEKENEHPVFEFLTEQLNDPRQKINIGSLNALGELKDQRAAAILSSYTTDSTPNRIQQAAKNALEKLNRETPITPNEIIQLRESVNTLKKQTTDLTKRQKQTQRKLARISSSPHVIPAKAGIQPSRMGNFLYRKRQPAFSVIQTV